MTTRQTSISRRTFLSAATAATATPLLGTLGGSAAMAQSKPSTMAFGTFSGQFEKATMASVVPCFEEKTGIRAVLVVGTPTGNLAKIQADPANPPMEVFVGLQESTYQAIDTGVAEKLDFSRIPNAKDVPDEFKDSFDGYAISMNSGSWGVTYDKDRISNPPKSWQEFVEATIRGDYGNNVGMPGVPTYPHIAVWQTINAYGKKFDEEGIDFAFEKLRAMRPNISRIWAQLSEPGNLLVSGDIAISPLNDGRSYATIDGGADNLVYTRLEEGAIATTSDLVKVKNSSDYAYEFINCFLDADVQTEFATFFPGYYFTNQNATYSEEAQVRTAKREQLLFPPAREIARMLPALIERWNREMAN